MPRKKQSEPKKQQLRAKPSKRTRKTPKQTEKTKVPPSAGTLTWLGNDVYESTSDTTPGKTYQLAVLPSGRVTCQCGSFLKHRGRQCKHGKRVKLVHDNFTNEQRALWPIGYQIPEKYYQTKNHILASKQFYQKNVRRRPEPVIAYSDGRDLKAHKENVRTKSEIRGIEILIDLLTAIAQSFGMFAPSTDGRSGRSPADRVLAIVLKTMFGASLTNFVQRKNAHQLLGSTIGVRTINRYAQNVVVRDLLRQCLREMTAAIHSFATHLTVDSSGFPTLQQMNYRNDDKGRSVIRPYAVYIRGHFLACAATNIIVSMFATYNYGKDSSDHSQLVPLLSQIKGLLKPKYILADKAYFSDEHMLACEAIGAMFICPPKTGWTPKNSDCRFLAEKLYALYQAKDEFDEIYSWRAKAETVFSTIEQLYGKAIAARGAYGKDPESTEIPLSIEIELLAKCVAQNITRFVYLEAVLEQTVSFTEHCLLRRMEQSRLKSGRSLLVDEAS